MPIKSPLYRKTRSRVHKQERATHASTKRTSKNTTYNGTSRSIQQPRSQSRTQQSKQKKKKKEKEAWHHIDTGHITKHGQTTPHPTTTNHKPITLRTTTSSHRHALRPQRHRSRRQRPRPTAARPRGPAFEPPWSTSPRQAPSCGTAARTAPTPLRLHACLAWGKKGRQKAGYGHSSHSLILIRCTIRSC